MVDRNAARSSAAGCASASPRVAFALIAATFAFLTFMPPSLHAETVPSAEIFVDSTLDANKAGIKAI